MSRYSIYPILLEFIAVTPLTSIPEVSKVTTQSDTSKALQQAHDFYKSKYEELVDQSNAG